MNKNSEAQFDRVLPEALQLRERGVPTEEILARFPQCREELTEIFRILVVLREEKERLIPPRTALANLLPRLRRVLPSVTNMQSARYVERGERKGRTSYTNIDQIYNLMARKVAIGAGVVVILLFLVFSARQGQKASRPAVSPPQQRESVTVIPATGNPSDVLNALLADSSGEQALASEANDASLINADSLAIDEFGQSYENEF